MSKRFLVQVSIVDEETRVVERVTIYDCPADFWWEVERSFERIANEVMAAAGVKKD